MQKQDTWHGYAVLPAGSEPEVPIKLSEAEWRQRLTDLQFKVLRQEATEAACSGATWNEHRRGSYYSAASGQPLFSSEAKFDSGTGWPSFYQPLQADAVILRWDDSFGMRRIEVLDSSTASHLGHIFDDATGTPSGLRFCMNSASLIFVPLGEPEPDLVRQYRQDQGTDLVK